MIGGIAKRRALRAPRIAGLRPTSDRVKEAIFDILASLGAVEGASVLDGFCGSGALGIEALSRGARAVTFVDSDRRALDAVRENLQATGLAGPPKGAGAPRAPAPGAPAAPDLLTAPLGAVRIVPGELKRLLGREPDHDFDLALLDPPYRFDEWASLLGDLHAGLAVLESATPPELPEGYVLRREYRYGGTLVTLVEARGSTDRG